MSLTLNPRSYLNPANEEVILNPVEDGNVAISDLPTELADRVRKTSSIASSTFSNPALEIMNLGIALERFQSEGKLSQYKQEGSDLKDTIDRLLSVSAKLGQLPSNADTHVLTEELKTDLSDLRAKGIDLFPGAENSIKKEDIASGKSLISSHIDSHRLKLQELFATKISVTIQFLNTITDVMKDVCRKNDKLLEVINGNSAR